MSRIVCDARKGVFTDLPPVDSNKPATEKWRIEKGWNNYIAARIQTTTCPLQICGVLRSEFKEVLANKYPKHWNRGDIAETENPYSSNAYRNIQQL